MKGELPSEGDALDEFVTLTRRTANVPDADTRCRTGKEGGVLVGACKGEREEETRDRAESEGARLGAPTKRA